MFKNPSAHKKVFFIISIVLVAISVLSMAIRGFNLGIDFTGGTTFEIEHMPTGFKYDGNMEKELEALVLKANPKATSQIQSLGADGVFIKVSELSDAQQSVLVASIVDYFTAKAPVSAPASAPSENVSEVPTEPVAAEAPTEVATGEATPEATPEGTQAPVTNATAFEKSIKIDKVNGTTSARLISDTLLAVLIAVALMLAYISWRFDFKSGVCAVMALCHDVILMFGFYSVFYLTMNTSFVAAVLTIIGYSINATIIVFDRVRENNKLMSRQASYDDKADASIKTSYTRTIYSSLTTLFTIGALYVLGVSSIREFALPIIVGIVCGAYSSLFVAPTFWAFWKDASEKSKKTRKQN